MIESGRTLTDTGQKHIYDYRIDARGDWFCEGNPVTDRQLFCLLSRSLYELDGNYFIRCEGEVHPVRVADAPLWIRYVHLEKDQEGGLLEVEIQLEDGRREPLAAETLTTVDNQSIYCLVTRRKLKARFGKVAYYELARHLEFDEKGSIYYLTIAGRRFALFPEEPKAE